MTTIATDGKSVAADGLGTVNNLVVERAGEKVRKLRDGSLLGVAGDAFALDQIADWLEAGAVPADRPEGLKVDVLLIRPGGSALMCGNSLRLTACDLPYAIGSGGDLAMGAMAAGKSPAEAVEIAARYDINTGGRVRTYRVPRRR